MGDVELYKPDDMTEKELKSLADYKEKGLPGIGKVASNDVSNWYNLYLSGKTYREISEIVGVKPDIILYHAQKNKWFDAKVRYFEGIISNINRKTTQAKLESTNTVASIVSALNKYYANKFNRFLRTNDEQIIDGLDPKVLNQYYKSIETLDRLMGQIDPSKEENDKKPSTVINLNSNNAQVKQNEDGSIDITDLTAKELLLGLSKIKKEEKK